MMPSGADQDPCGAFHCVPHTADHGLHPIMDIPYPLAGCPNGMPATCPLDRPVECLAGTEICLPPGRPMGQPPRTRSACPFTPRGVQSGEGSHLLGRLPGAADCLSSLDETQPPK